MAVLSTLGSDVFKDLDWSCAEAPDQLSLFTRPRSRVLMQLRIGSHDLAQWHALGWLSDETRDAQSLRCEQIAELEFVRDVARCGLDADLLDRWLAYLPRPFRIDPVRVAFSFDLGWVTPPLNLTLAQVLSHRMGEIASLLERHGKHSIFATVRNAMLSSAMEYSPYEQDPVRWPRPYLRVEESLQPRQAYWLRASPSISIYDDEFQTRSSAEYLRLVGATRDVAEQWRACSWIGELPPQGGHFTRRSWRDFQFVCGLVASGLPHGQIDYLLEQLDPARGYCPISTALHLRLGWVTCPEMLPLEDLLSRHLSTALTELALDAGPPVADALCAELARFVR